MAKLRELYGEALSHPSVVGLVIGTRPDCVNEEKLDYLASLCGGKAQDGGVVFADEKRRPIIVVEYGIESCYDVTLKRINRGPMRHHLSFAADIH